MLAIVKDAPHTENVWSAFLHTALYTLEGNPWIQMLFDLVKEQPEVYAGFAQFNTTNQSQFPLFLLNTNSWTIRQEPMMSIIACADDPRELVRNTGSVALQLLIDKGYSCPKTTTDIAGWKEWVTKGKVSTTR